MGESAPDCPGRAQGGPRAAYGAEVDTLPVDRLSGPQKGSQRDALAMGRYDSCESSRGSEAEASRAYAYRAAGGCHRSSHWDDASPLPP